MALTQNIRCMLGKARCLLVALVVALAAGPAGATCVFDVGNVTVESVKFTKKFKYLEPGVLFPPTSFMDANGRPKTRSHSRYVAVPNLVFPFDMDPREAPEDVDDDQQSAAMAGDARTERDSMPALMESIVGSFGGCDGPRGGDQFDKRNFLYPDRDNFGETREAPNHFVSNGRGHQGCDIRNPTGRKDADVVRAAETGTVVQVSRSGHIAIQTRPQSQGGSGTMQFYLHIEKALVRRGDEVAAGQPIGLAGTIIRGQRNGTLPHLHFEIRTSSFVFDGETKTRTINLASGNWGIALPCYPSLVAAKMRELNLEPQIVGDQLVKDPRYEVTLRQFMTGDYGTPDTTADNKPEPELVEPPPVGKGYDSYWTIDNVGRDDAVLGLIKNADNKGTDEFYLLTKRSTMFSSFRSSATEERVFSGHVEPGDVKALRPARYVGTLTLLDPSDDPDKRCDNVTVDAAGPILDRPPRLELTAEVPLREPYPSCKDTGDKRTDVYSLVFYGNSRPAGEPGAQDAMAIVDKDRKTLVEVTRNWGAITMPFVDRAKWFLEAVDPDPASKKKPRDPSYPWVYAGAWPGLKPIGERLDKFGQAVPAFETDEAGVSLWWFWIVRRKGFGVDGNPSIRELAHGIAGDAAKPPTVANYINNYVPLARKYFKRVIDADSRIALGDPDDRFALAWTMFHHESGRTPLIDRAVFERGIQLGNDLIATSYKRLCDYDVKPCGGPDVVTAGSDSGGASDGDVAPTPPIDDSARPDPPNSSPDELLTTISRLEDDVETLKDENQSLIDKLDKAEVSFSKLLDANKTLTEENNRLRNTSPLPAKTAKKKSQRAGSQKPQKTQRRAVTRIRSRFCSGGDGWLLCGGD